MKRRAYCALMLLAALLLGGCASSAEGELEPRPTSEHLKAQTVAWPQDKLEAGENGVPTLAVYVADSQKTVDMDVESYVERVLAGEMKNDWPLEALKAQAILARTFVLKFVDEKESKYPDADISTDIEEAQAYDAEAVNDRIRQAVAETKGMVLSSGGELPYAWFHAHSGGVTALAVEGLGWDKDEPSYTQVVRSQEPEQAQDMQTLASAQEWEADFPLEEFAAACKEAGTAVDIGDDTELGVAQRGESGRAVTIGVGSAEVSASALRIALGSTKMRSTLLTSLRLENGAVHMAGKGYGHGVGMSQWGAYGMAQAGRSAQEIVKHYFRNVELVEIW